MHILCKYFTKEKTQISNIKTENARFETNGSKQFSSYTAMRKFGLNWITWENKEHLHNKIMFLSVCIGVSD